MNCARCRTCVNTCYVPFRALSGWRVCPSENMHISSRPFSAHAPFILPTFLSVSLRPCLLLSSSSLGSPVPKQPGPASPPPSALTPPSHSLGHRLGASCSSGARSSSSQGKDAPWCVEKPCASSIIKFSSNFLCCLARNSFQTLHNPGAGRAGNRPGLRPTPLNHTHEGGEHRCRLHRSHCPLVESA